MPEKIPAYDGTGSYVFVSYSHKDSRQVYPVIMSLHEQGYNIWYDEGIPLVVNYGGELYRRIKGCKVFLLFVSKNSVLSDDVSKEVENAFALKKKIVRINIDDSPMPDSWNYHIPPTSQYISIDAEPGEFYSKLCQAIAECRSSDSELGARLQTVQEDAATDETSPSSPAVNESKWVKAKNVFWKIWSPMVVFCAFYWIISMFVFSVLYGGTMPPMTYEILVAVSTVLGIVGAVIILVIQNLLQKSNKPSPKRRIQEKALNGLTCGATVFVAIWAYSVSLLHNIIALIAGIVVGIVAALMTGKEKRKHGKASTIVFILFHALAAPLLILCIVAIIQDILFYFS